MFQHDGIHGSLVDVLKPVLQGTLAYSGMDVLPPFVGWHIPYITDEERSSVLVEYLRHLECLDDVEKLRFPSLEEYDNQLRPLKQAQTG